MALGLVTLSSSDQLFKSIVIPDFLQALRCRFCLLRGADFFSLHALRCKYVCVVLQIFADFFSGNFTLILLFFLFLCLCAFSTCPQVRSCVP